MPSDRANTVPMIEFVAKKGVLSGANSFMAVSAAVLVIAFLALTIFNLELADKAYVGLQQLISTRLAGYFAWVVTFIAGFSLLLAVSPFGAVKLGGDDEQPAFGHFSWFAMLFSAGVGTGILFWSVAEPIIHYQGNPFIDLAGIEPNTEAAAIVAQRITLFHWGIHGWAIYAVIGLCLGYFSYRKGLPLSVRSALYPMLGNRIYGPLGHAIDLLAIFSTVFGIATSLGLGASQMNGGLKYLLDIEWATWPIVLLSTILIVTWFVTSSDSGTLVICTMLSMGDTRPPQKFRVFWGMAVGLVAGALLLAGGLQTLQAASTIIAVPFSVVILLMIVGLSKSLWQTEMPRYS